jgi:hypothetical protein
MLHRLLSVIAVFIFCAVCTESSVAQFETRPFSSLGVGVKASLLGAGMEAATPLAGRSICEEASTYSAMTGPSTKTA